MTKKTIFIVGSKGIPANYGGFERFVDKITQKRKDEMIDYHVACMTTKPREHMSEYQYNHARCFNVYVPNIGPAKAVYYDIQSVHCCLSYIKKNNIKNPIIYVLACRIGPFISFLKRKIVGVGGQLYVNPDGHEWKRGKWSFLVQRYWKISEKLMIKSADLVICDSKAIESYILANFAKYQPNAIFIAYGADQKKSSLARESPAFSLWLSERGLVPERYFLLVGRFVPENNYELIISEFLKTSTTKDLVIVSNVEKNRYFKKLQHLDVELDKRIKFVGTVYEEELLKKIREEAYAYIHGHEVGGTNPSLLEALSSTSVNLLLNVEFNSEVAQNSALYWEKKEGSLGELIVRVDQLTREERLRYATKAKQRVELAYNWEKIVQEYEDIWAQNRTPMKIEVDDPKSN